MKLENGTQISEGEFLIHASKIPDEKAMKKFGFKNLPCGFIIGKAILVDVKKYKDKEEFNKDKDQHLATIDWGTYGFVLKNPEKIKPISVKGNLSFWEFDYQKKLLLFEQVYYLLTEVSS